MRGATGRRPRAGLAALVACALLLQALGALLPSAGSAGAATLPFGALVICTPDGIRILEPEWEPEGGPDGAPLETPAEDAPASTAEPCQLCCLSRACCQGLLAGMAAAAFAPARTPSFGRPAPASPHRLFPLAKRGRGPPMVRTRPQTV